MFININEVDTWDEKDSKQGTNCLFLWPATGDSLPVILARYRRLIACFSGPLQETIACFSGPSTLTISAKSAILELKGG